MLAAALLPDGPSYRPENQNVRSDLVRDLYAACQAQPDDRSAKRAQCL